VHIHLFKTTHHKHVIGNDNAYYISRHIGNR